MKDKGEEARRDQGDERRWQSPYVETKTLKAGPKTQQSVCKRGRDKRSKEQAAKNKEPTAQKGNTCVCAPKHSKVRA